MNKSLLTNLISGFAFIFFYFLPPFPGRQALASASLFALSGALTNWLAIHMLFEKIPGLYGSGIIPNRFEEFKKGIRQLIIANFFTKSNFSAVARSAFHDDLHIEKLIERIDFDDFFAGFTQVVMESSVGGMMKMMGAESMLDSFREPFEEEFRTRMINFLNEVDINKILEQEKDFGSFRTKIEVMIDTELGKLTPQRVKEIIEEMIREHLGWLVVWGGVFGALIGLLSGFLLI
ncbi:MAG: DUF445 domain-containing protein [Candidatus Cloacimonetes bacterium 4572_55]|nr:MAG: DUF445 domain-containing protein [Candidatus Cloacimonetes bacterium 4572_55]